MDAPTCPRSRTQLRNWLRNHLRIDLPARPFVPGHNAPLDYITHTLFEGKHHPFRPGPARPQDCVVWANRGGGKTFLGALATALDLAFKPGIQVRILAGSLQQAQRMHEHLRRLFEQPPLADLLDGKPTQTRLQLANGSRCELLAQSQTAVRGTRVHKLRCDEVECFDPDVWEAAQLTTRSGTCGPFRVRGAVEALSTMHRPFGLMADIVRDAHSAGRTLFRWSLLDVLQPPPPNKPKPPGPIDADLLAPRAPDQRGHITLADALAMQRRVSRQTWNAEMLCIAPDRSHSVFPAFSTSTHVVDTLPPDALAFTWAAGMDFGYRAPTVVCFAAIAPDGTIFVADELVRSETPLPRIARDILDAPWPRPDFIAIDPAGNAVSLQTGRSDANTLAALGLRTRSVRLGVLDGIELLRARIDPADGPPRLFVHRRCAHLVDALLKYHFDPQRPEDPSPVKDGPDHAVDALRYLVAAVDNRHPARAGNYCSGARS